LLLAAGFAAHRLRTSSIRRHSRALLEESLQRQRAEASARRLGRQVLSAREDEAKRIALELHDDIGQQLAMLIVRLEMSGDNGSQDGNASLAKSIAGDIHHLSHALYPGWLVELGLVSALRALGREFSEQTELAVDVELEDLTEEGDEVSSLCLYRIAQESLRNALKHSEAKSAAVSLSLEGSNLVLTVEDDGIGFDADSAAGSGLGLSGMQDRVRAIGGKLTLETRPGSGTRISVRVPFRAPGHGGPGT
jgi:signal transduction histidine kinase